MTASTFDPDAPDAKQHRRWPLLLAAGALLALIVFGLWPRPLPVETAMVERGRLQVTVDEEGRTRVKNRYTVTAPVSGQLRRVPLKAGALVEAGKTVVASFETAAATPLDARSREQAEASMQAAVNSRAQAEARQAAANATQQLEANELKRAHELADRGVISPQELAAQVARTTIAQEGLTAAGFGLKIAEFELAQARAALGRGVSDDADHPLFTLNTPIDGRVLRVFEESARLVAAGTPLLEVGDATDLEIVIEVLSRDAVGIQPGARVFLEQWGGAAPLNAQVRLVEPAGFTKISALGVEEQRVNVIADLLDPIRLRGSLGDGYRVEARIVTADVAEALLVPTGALFQQGGRWQTYLVSEGRAERHEVEVGQSNGVLTEVRRGLVEGDEVVVYPGDQLVDGARVRRLQIVQP